jgi:hypothetical protein
MDLYTKNGKPLQVLGDLVYSRSGIVVGKINENKVFGKDGRYIGTISSERLVYRSEDNDQISSPFSVANRVGAVKANRAGSNILGDEPNIPD